MNFWNLKKKIGKFFNSLVQKPLSNLGNAIDVFFIKIFKKKLVKNFDNLVQKKIFEFNDLLDKFFGKNSKTQKGNQVI